MNADVRNDGGDGKFRLLMRVDGVVIDETPSIGWVDLSRSEQHTFEVSTEFDPRYDVFSLGPEFEVAVLERDVGIGDRQVVSTPRPRGDITLVVAERDEALIGNDELDVCVSFTNAGEVLGEFRVVLSATDGTVLDREPDLSWRDLAPNATDQICVGTSFLLPSIEDVGPEFTVELVEQHIGVTDAHVDRTP